MWAGIGGHYPGYYWWVGILYYLELFHETSYLLFLYNEFRGFGYEIISGGGQWVFVYLPALWLTPVGFWIPPPPPRRGGGLFAVTEKTRIHEQLLVLRVLRNPPRNRVYH